METTCRCVRPEILQGNNHSGKAGVRASTEAAVGGGMSLTCCSSPHRDPAGPDPHDSAPPLIPVRCSPGEFTAEIPKTLIRL